MNGAVKRRGAPDFQSADLPRKRTGENKSNALLAHYLEQINQKDLAGRRVALAAISDRCRATEIEEVDFVRVDDIKAALRRENNSAPWSDGIRYKDIGRLSDKELGDLSDMYNSSIVSAIVQEEWLHSYLIPLSKQGKVDAKIRVITMQNTTGKLLEKITARNICYQLERLHLHPPTLGSYCPNRETWDIAAVFANDVYKGFHSAIETAYNKAVPVGLFPEASRVTWSEPPRSVIMVMQGSNEKWLDAYHDPLASLYTFTQCLTLSDIQADGDWKLIVADLGTGSYDMKLKVYKNTTLMSEHTIIDLPTGVVTFYMDNLEPRTPAIAVASGPYIYVYKNLRPYFKFTLPPLDIHPVEEDLWNQAKNDHVNIYRMRETLEGLRQEGTSLTVRSLKLLQLETNNLDSFVQLHKNTPLKKQTVITCLGTMKKSVADEDAISCLVLGTENRSIYVLDPGAFTVLAVVDLPSVPVFISVNGLFDVDYRIVVSCRNGRVYTLKRGSKDVTRNMIELSSQPVGMERISKNIYVGCMDETLHCFTSKGKKLWTVRLPTSITTLQVIDYKTKSFTAILVALSNQEVHIYKEKFLVDVIKMDDIVTGMCFGRFGREDGTLVMSGKRGGLYVKILKRTATFDEKDISAGPPKTQNVKLNVPKKTKLFVDQTQRERENGVVMHRTFQRDLARLRLRVLQEYVKALDSSMSPISSDPMEPIKLSARVQGIGPTFKFTVSLQNTSLSQPSTNLFITFDYDDKLYYFHNKLIQVPMLVPGLTYNFDSFVDCLNDKGVTDSVKVYVIKPGRAVPIITGVVSMPISENITVA